MTDLSEFIKSFRKQHKLSLRQFADCCGLSHSYVDNLEKGVDPRNGKGIVPTLDTLEKIASAMNILDNQSTSILNGRLFSKDDFEHLKQYIKNGIEYAKLRTWIS